MKEKKLNVPSDETESQEADFPFEDYYCQATPGVVQPVANKIVRKFYNWAQANSLWILAFGTGCGSIELPPLFTSRYDISRFGIMPRPTPHQSGVFIISG